MRYNIFADYDQAMTKQPVLWSGFTIPFVAYNIKIKKNLPDDTYDVSGSPRIFCIMNCVKNTIKLIASDLDGTLVSGNMGKLPEKFPALVRELKRRGILFAAASGRQYHNLRRLFDEVKDDIAYICENGALTVYQGEVLQKTEIPAGTASLIIRRLEAEPDTEVLVSGAFCSYINPKDPYFEQYISDMHNKYKVVPDLTDIGEPVIKLALFEKAGTESRDRQTYWQNQFMRSESFPFDVRVVTSGALWLDFLFPNSDKGAGIRALADHFGLRREEILSFGDNFNDIEMFQASGTSVAVENARPGIAKLCDYTTLSVVGFIEEMLDKTRSGSYSGANFIATK